MDYFYKYKKYKNKYLKLLEYYNKIGGNPDEDEVFIAECSNFTQSPPSIFKKNFKAD